MPKINQEIDARRTFVLENIEVVSFESFYERFSDSLSRVHAHQAYKATLVSVGASHNAAKERLAEFDVSVDL